MSCLLVSINLLLMPIMWGFLAYLGMTNPANCPVNATGEITQQSIATGQILQRPAINFLIERSCRIRQEEAHQVIKCITGDIVLTFP
jgi:hypothetical protein